MIFTSDSGGNKHPVLSYDSLGDDTLIEEDEGVTPGDKENKQGHAMISI